MLLSLLQKRFRLFFFFLESLVLGSLVRVKWAFLLGARLA